MSALALVPSSLSEDELEKRLSIAVATDDKPTIHALAEERLSRHEYMSGVSRRHSMLLQTIDLDLMRLHETWRLGHYESFYAYLKERRVEHERRGFDAEGGVLVAKNYSTVMAWSNIVSHFHRRHGIRLDLLAHAPKRKLEIVSGVCNRWDMLHDDEMDKDLLGLLFEESVSSEDILSLYAHRKRSNGEPEPVNDDGGRIETDQEDEGIERRDRDEPDQDEEGGDNEQEELEVVLDMGSGDLTAWVRKGSGHVPARLGALLINNVDVHELIVNLCQTWRVRLQ